MNAACYRKTKGGQPQNKNAEKWTEEKAMELGENLIKWMRPKIDPATKKDLHELNILFKEYLIPYCTLNECTIRYLRKKFDSFSRLYDDAKEIQKIKLMKCGLFGLINPYFAVFMLINFHGLKVNPRNQREQRQTEANREKRERFAAKRVRELKLLPNKPMQR